MYNKKAHVSRFLRDDKFKMPPSCLANLPIP